MSQFTDTNHRTWNIHVTFAAIRRVREAHGINLIDIADGDPPLLQRLETDIVLLIDVIWTLIEPQAVKHGVDDQQFGESLGGSAVADAHDAFWRALADFFHEARMTDRARAIERQTEIVTKATNIATEEINAIQIDALMENARASVSPNSPASSASTPDR